MRLPSPLRVAVGLVASAADEAKHLPDRAIELPMLAVSTALQMSLRAQQRYARLAARGDDVLNRRAPSDEPPPWATFDEPVAIDELRRAALADIDEASTGPGAAVLAGLFGAHESGPAGTGDAHELTEVDEPAPAAAAKPPARKNAPRKAAAAKTAKTAKKTVATRRATTNDTAGLGGKTVSKPRHTAPSRFDEVDDDVSDEVDDDVSDEVDD